jgi:hypothetical protein
MNSDRIYRHFCMMARALGVRRLAPHPSGASSLAWCAILLAVAVPLTLRSFRAKTMG